MMLSIWQVFKKNIVSSIIITIIVSLLDFIMVRDFYAALIIFIVYIIFLPLIHYTDYINMRYARFNQLKYLRANKIYKRKE